MRIQPGLSAKLGIGSDQATMISTILRSNAFGESFWYTPTLRLLQGRPARLKRCRCFDIGYKPEYLLTQLVVVDNG